LLERSSAAWTPRAGAELLMRQGRVAGSASVAPAPRHGAYLVWPGLPHRLRRHDARAPSGDHGSCSPSCAPNCATLLGRTAARAARPSAAACDSHPSATAAGRAVRTGTGRAPSALKSRIECRGAERLFIQTREPMLERLGQVAAMRQHTTMVRAQSRAAQRPSANVRPGLAARAHNAAAPGRWHARSGDRTPRGDVLRHGPPAGRASSKTTRATAQPTAWVTEHADTAHTAGSQQPPSTTRRTGRRPAPGDQTRHCVVPPVQGGHV
jgi:hypothetical protein